MKQCQIHVHLLLLVFFFELSNEPNEYLQPIIDALAHIRYKNLQQPISDDFELMRLISKDHLRRYYRYDGSLTTPPCYESVIWSVLQEPLKISHAQLEAFRALRGEENHLLEKTYRPIQSIGTRKLFRSFHAKDINDEPKTTKNRAPYFSINRTLFLILISFLMIII